MSALPSSPSPAVPPLIQRLAQAPDSGWIGTDTLAGFLAEPGDAVLFLWSDPVRFPEVLDVAVVLPELRRRLGSSDAAPIFRVGVVEAASENGVAARFGAQHRPSLVFLRDGQYLGAVNGMLDWEVFVQRVADTLAQAPGRAPGIGIPVLAQGAGGCH